MNTNDYTVTMTYKEFKKWQAIESDLTELKQALTSCYTEQDNGIMLVDITKLKNIGKELLPIRYENYNYQEVR